MTPSCCAIRRCAMRSRGQRTKAWSSTSARSMARERRQRVLPPPVTVCTPNRTKSGSVTISWAAAEDEFYSGDAAHRVPHIRIDKWLRFRWRHRGEGGDTQSVTLERFRSEDDPTTSKLRPSTKAANRRHRRSWRRCPAGAESKCSSSTDSIGSIGRWIRSRP